LLLPSEKMHCQLFLFHHEMTLIFDYHRPSMPNTQTLKNCVLLGYYTTSSGNSLRTFWDNLSVLTSKVKKHYLLHKNSPEHSSHLLHTQSPKSCTQHLLNFYGHLLYIIFINCRNRCQIWYGKSTVRFMRYNEFYSSGMHRLAVWIASHSTRQQCSKSLTQELQISFSLSIHYNANST